MTPTLSIEPAADTSYRRVLQSWFTKHPYVSGFGMIAVATGLGFAVSGVLPPANLAIIYMLVVFVTALQWGERPAIFTAIVSALVFDYCFVPPFFSFAMTDLAYLVTLAGFAAVAIVTSRLAARAEAMIREQAARQQAEALNKAKDIVLHKITHELRSPLTAVLGWTQLLRVGLDQDQISSSLSEIEHSARLLKRLIDDLWNASRAGSGKLTVRLQPTLLAPVVANALDRVTGAADEKQVHVESLLEPVGEILGDDFRLEQIVTNLVSNAIKFTPVGGNITVRLSHASEGALLTVSDNGIGIAAEFLPHMFDPFTQADPKNSQGGLGLGLSIVKYLVEAHHGSISVSSNGERRGATFFVTLPLAGSDHVLPA